MNFVAPVLQKVDSAIHTDLLENRWGWWDGEAEKEQDIDYYELLSGDNQLYSNTIKQLIAHCFCSACAVA